MLDEIEKFHASTDNENNINYIQYSKTKDYFLSLMINAIFGFYI